MAPKGRGRRGKSGAATSAEPQEETSGVRSSGRKRKAESSSNQEQAKKNAVLVDAEPESGAQLEVRWEWQGDGDVWYLYSEELNEEITKAFRAGKSSVTISPNTNVKLRVDLKKMVQKNVQSGFERPLGVAAGNQDQYFSWLWEDDEGSWNPYDPDTTLQLEKAQQANQKSILVTFGKTAYTLNLGKMVQINDRTQFERKMERRESVAVEFDTKSESTNTADGPAPAAKKPPGNAKKPAKGKAADAETGGGDQKKEVKSESKETVKTLVLSGKAPVDPECKAKLGKVKVWKSVRDHQRACLQTGGGSMRPLKLHPWEEICLSLMDEASLEGVGAAELGSAPSGNQAGPSGYVAPRRQARKRRAASPLPAPEGQDPALQPVKGDAGPSPPGPSSHMGPVRQPAGPLPAPAAPVQQQPPPPPPATVPVASESAAPQVAPPVPAAPLTTSPVLHPSVPAVPGSSPTSPGDKVTLTLVPLQPHAPPHPLSSPVGRGRWSEGEMVEGVVVESPHNYSVPSENGRDVGNSGGEEPPPLPERPRDEVLERLQRLESVGIPPHAHDSKVLVALEAQVAAQGGMKSELVGLRSEPVAMRTRLVCMETAQRVAARARKSDISHPLRCLVAALNAQTRQHRIMIGRFIAALNGLTAAIQQAAISAVPSPVPVGSSSPTPSAPTVSTQPTPTSSPPSQVRQGPRQQGGTRRGSSRGK